MFRTQFMKKKSYFCTNIIEDEVIYVIRLIYLDIIRDCETSFHISYIIALGVDSGLICAIVIPGCGLGRARTHNTIMM